MGRSNNAARQRNAKGRLNRRVKGQPRMGPPSVAGVARLSPEELVIPDGQCLRNPARPKARFATEAKAKVALEQAQRQRARMGSGHVERRYYLCRDIVGTNEDGTPRIVGCEGYHLTSRETYDNAWKRATP